jgi:hypothetical protein
LSLAVVTAASSNLHDGHSDIAAACDRLSSELGRLANELTAWLPTATHLRYRSTAASTVVTHRLETTKPPLLDEHLLVGRDLSTELAGVTECVWRCFSQLDCSHHRILLVAMADVDPGDGPDALLATALSGTHGALLRILSAAALHSLDHTTRVIDCVRWTSDAAVSPVVGGCFLAAACASRAVSLIHISQQWSRTFDDHDDTGSNSAALLWLSRVVVAFCREYLDRWTTHNSVPCQQALFLPVNLTPLVTQVNAWCRCRQDVAASIQSDDILQQTQLLLQKL